MKKQEMYFMYKDKDRIKVCKWKKIYSVNWGHKKAEVAILIIDKPQDKRILFTEIPKW